MAIRNRLALFAALGLAAAAAHAQQGQEVYRWVDEDGVVHYSDQPVPGAEVVTLQKAPAGRAPAPAPRSAAPAARTEPPPASQPFAYQSISIASPTAEQTLWNIGGTLNVSINVTPGLRSGDRVRLYFDGEAQTITGTQTQLSEVWRGTHNLQAEVVDANGALMIRSDPIRFYVQQTSILNP